MPLRIVSQSVLRNLGVQRSDSVLVGLSGGADSTALLLSLVGLSDEGAIGEVAAAHLHHGIRGDGADADMAFCVRLCERLHVRLFTERRSVPEERRQGETLEQAARRIRYEFFERVRAQNGLTFIATAHNGDDQAETVLLHLIRGSGTSGLTGIRAGTGHILRPLLGVSRREIEAFLEACGEAFCTDETNASDDYTRNRVRHVLLPMLASFNPDIVASLNRTAALVGMEDDFLASLAEDAERRLTRGEGLERSGLQNEAEVIARRVIRSRLRAMDPDYRATDIERVFGLLGAETGTRIELRGGCSAWTDAGTLYLGRYPEQRVFEVPFRLEGETVTPSGRFVSERVDAFFKPKDAFTAYFDRDKLPDDLVVRTRRDGDRFYPFGAPGKKKLGDFFTDAKLPMARRDVPLLASGNRVYYVAGIRTGEYGRVTERTRTILKITYTDFGR